MRQIILTPIALALTATGAAAHPGHWAEVGGHDHWVAGIAIGAAALAALWGALKGRKGKDEASEDEAEETPA